MPNLDNKAPRTSVQLTNRATIMWSLAAQRAGITRTAFLEILLRSLGIPVEEVEAYAKSHASNTSTTDSIS